MWSDVEQCGAMWSNVRLTTAMWSDVEQCGMGGTMHTYIIGNKIYRTIEFDQKIGNNTNAPHCGLQAVHSLVTQG